MPFEEIKSEIINNNTTSIQTNINSLHNNNNPNNILILKHLYTVQYITKIALIKSMEQSRHFIIAKKDKRRYYIKCYHKPNTCQFIIRASKNIKKNTNKYTIQKVNLTHSCNDLVLSNNNRKQHYNIKQLSNLFNINELKQHNIIQLLQQKYNIKLKELQTYKLLDNINRLYPENNHSKRKKYKCSICKQHGHNKKTCNINKFFNI